MIAQKIRKEAASCLGRKFWRDVVGSSGLRVRLEVKNCCAPAFVRVCVWRPPHRASAMAYRGQGQKVQKVMVQPIVSFRAGWAREMGRSAIRGGGRWAAGKSGD